ncbi:MAG: right-handed parallel beta-helix repeat-containing protein, partial [Anaerolineales bacterium]|nr:right-handed parallel beta-helix repeat-containing protein [Anaerolineales bacterium]
MREGWRFLSLVKSFQWNRVWRFGFVGLPPLVALIGLLSLFGLVDIRSSAALGVIRYVTANGVGTVCSQGVPCALQTAVSQSQSDDEVHVAAGTYITTGTPLLLLNKTITVTGGYDSSNWSAAPDPQLNQTILDGQTTAQVVRIEGAVNPALEGFEIRNGVAIQGAGIYNQMGAPLIRNNKIYDNDGTQSGGVGAGIFDDGSATIENNTIYNNHAQANGGGIAVHLNNGLTTISFNEIYDNSAGSFGGGIFLHVNTEAMIEGNVIHNNTADSGAGFGTFGPTAAALQNNMFYQNQASDLGGAVFAAGSMNIWNDTIAANSATTNGGGIFVEVGATVQISNTIIVSNTGSNMTGIRQAIGAGVSGDYNNIFGNTSDPTFSNTIAADPEFINFATFNLHLQSGSPNEDAGDPGTPASLNIDIDHQVRPNGAAVDIGADEIYPDVPGFTLTPVSTSKFVDRGTTAVFTHTLENIGTVADNYTFICSNDRNWVVV